MSSSLYDTFGNEPKVTLTGDTLVYYLENATIKFPLPEASTDILSKLADPRENNYNPVKADMVKSKLIKAGYSEANATALTPVLMKVANIQGIDPLEFFNANANTLNLTVDAYNAMNQLRPVGSRVGILVSNINTASKAKSLIKP